MKKLAIISVILITTAYTAFAQKDADAQKILNAVSKKYKGYDMMKADFSFTLDDQMSGMKDTQVGTLITQPKANKFKVIIYSPADKTTVAQEIISDGKSQWTYVKKDKEVELNNVDHSEDNINPAQLFTIYEHGYKYIYNGEEKIDGKVCQMIDLTPVDSKKQFFKVRLAIDKVKKQIYSATIFDKSGAKYTYVIRTFTPNPKLPETLFTFDKKNYPGVEVVDLR